MKQYTVVRSLPRALAPGFSKEKKDALVRLQYELAELAYETDYQNSGGHIFPPEARLGFLLNQCQAVLHTAFQAGLIKVKESKRKTGSSI